MGAIETVAESKKKGEIEGLVRNPHKSQTSCPSSVAFVDRQMVGAPGHAYPAGSIQDQIDQSGLSLQ